MFGIQDLDVLRRQILGDWQISRKGGVPIGFINRLHGGNTAGADKELLETLPATELLQGRRVTMIEVFVRDKNVIVNRLGALQVLVEKVGIKRKIDIAQDDVEGATPPPS
jgi:hypothetical protein